tara:strand:+ start:93 stop:551 length:459 start_codon:yes stop_codon:yes gene_type:complete
MANISHSAPGNIVVSRKIRITDALAESTNTNFEILQPANSVIDSVIIHTVGTVTMASTVDVSFNLGTASTYDGGQVVASALYIDGSDNVSALAGTALTTTIVDGVNTDALATFGNAASVTTDDRTLYGRFVTGAAAVSGGNEIEVHVAFRQF